MPNVKKTFMKADGMRKVEIFQRTDHTFGFAELQFGQEERAWFPVGKYSTAVIDSLDGAINEAKGRIAWLVDEA